jgi:hypothetical protein
LQSQQVLARRRVASIHELPRRGLLGNRIMISFSLVEGIVLSTQPSPLGRRQPRTPLVTLGVTARDPYRLVDRACTPPQKRGAPVYWYNPKTREMEDISTPTSDTEAIEMLDGHPNSVEFIAEYRGLRAMYRSVAESW